MENRDLIPKNIIKHKSSYRANVYICAINNNNNNVLYLDTLSGEETLFKGVYIGRPTIIGYTN